METQKNTHTLRNILLIAAALVIAFGALCLHGMLDYTHRVPHITPYEGLSFAKGSEVTAYDLAEITVQKKGAFVSKRILEAKWSDGTYDELIISENGEALRIGDKTGKLFVWVQATGAEAREAECIITVTA